MRRYKVGTFFRPAELLGRKLSANKIMAYTLWYNPAWDGCIEYDVEAKSGEAAKAIAIRLRLAHERAREQGGEVMRDVWEIDAALTDILRAAEQGAKGGENGE